VKDLITYNLLLFRKDWATVGGSSWYVYKNNRDGAKKTMKWLEKKRDELRIKAYDGKKRTL